MSDLLRLVEPQIPALRRYARALTRDRSTADDLVQDCLERAITHWQQRRDDGSPRAWLFSILHNLAMNRMSKASSQPRPVVLEEAGESALGRQAEQPDRLRHRDLLRGLEQLSEAHRSALLLVSVEDLSYAEAARVLGVPMGTVMSRLSRARERLAQMMDGEAVVEAPVNGSFLRRIK